MGRKPLGQSAAILRGNANYKLPFLESVSLDLAASWFSKRAAPRDNLVSLAPYLLMDLGARYQFKLGRSPATFCIQMQNITDAFAWSVVGSNSYGVMDKRRFSAFLAVDL